MAAMGGPGCVARYERTLNAKLTPIGWCEEGHMRIMMTEGGTVYIGYESLLYRMGEDGVDAVNSLCGGAVGVVVKVED
jgi:hypothetical protein